MKGLVVIVVLIGSVCPVRLNKRSAQGYVPLNSLTISSLFSETSTEKPAAEATEEYRPWWNNLQEKRKNKKKQKDKPPNRKAQAGARRRHINKVIEKFLNGYEKRERRTSHGKLKDVIVGMLYILSVNQYKFNEKQLMNTFYKKLYDTKYRSNEQPIPKDQRAYLTKLVEGSLAARPYLMMAHTETTTISPAEYYPQLSKEQTTRPPPPMAFYSQMSKQDAEEEEEETTTIRLPAVDYYPQLSQEKGQTTTERTPPSPIGQLSIKKFSSFQNRIPAKVYTSDYEPSTTTQGTNFKIFNRKKQPLSLDRLHQEHAKRRRNTKKPGLSFNLVSVDSYGLPDRTTRRTTTTATTTTRTTTTTTPMPTTTTEYTTMYEDVTETRHYGNHMVTINELLRQEETSTLMSIPVTQTTPPNYKVTFDNKKRVNGVTFRDLLKEPYKQKLSYSGSFDMKTTQRPRSTTNRPSRRSTRRVPDIKYTTFGPFGSTWRLTTKKPSRKGNSNNNAKVKKNNSDFANSKHFGMNSKQPKTPQNKGPSHLVSPFLFMKPLSFSEQFHHRQMTEVDSPSSAGNTTVTNAFLKASPFMSMQRDRKGTGQEEEYLKIKVVESPFLLNSNGDNEGNLLETKVQTVPDVITQFDPQKNPNLFKPSRLSELVRDSSNYYTQLAQYKKKHKHSSHVTEKEPYDPALPIQSDLQGSDPGSVFDEPENHKNVFLEGLKKTLNKHKDNHNHNKDFYDFNDINVSKKAFYSKFNKYDPEPSVNPLQTSPFLWAPPPPKPHHPHLEPPDIKEEKDPYSPKNQGYDILEEDPLRVSINIPEDSPSRPSSDEDIFKIPKFPWSDVNLPSKNEPELPVPSAFGSQGSHVVHDRNQVPDFLVQDSVNNRPRPTHPPRVAHIPVYTTTASPPVYSTWPWERYGVNRRGLSSTSTTEREATEENSTVDGGLKAPSVISSLFDDTELDLSEHQATHGAFQSSGPIEVPTDLQVHGDLEKILTRNRVGQTDTSPRFGLTDSSTRFGFTDTSSRSPFESIFANAQQRNFGTTERSLKPARVRLTTPKHSVNPTTTTKRSRYKSHRNRVKDISSKRKKEEADSKKKMAELKKQNMLLFELLQGALRSVTTATNIPKRSSSSTIAQRTSVNIPVADAIQPSASARTPVVFSHPIQSATLPNPAIPPQQLPHPKPQPIRFASAPVIYPLAQQSTTSKQTFTILQPQSIPLPRLSSKNKKGGGSRKRTQKNRNGSRNRSSFFGR